MAKWILTLCLLLLVSGQVMAGPASPSAEEVTQPDGTKLMISIRGDEFQNWTETLDGYTVVRNPTSGGWEYALPQGTKTTTAAPGADASAPPVTTTQNLVPSGLTPGRDAPPAESKNLRPQPNADFKARFQDSLIKSRQDNLRSRAAQQGAASGATASGLEAAPEAGTATWTTNPVSGTRGMLVILVNFANRQLTTTTQNWYDAVFNTTAGKKSVANFYKDNTLQKLTITPVPHAQPGNPYPGVVSVTIAANQPNYGKNFDYATEAAWLNLALAQAANYVNFNSLDTNGDGTITPAKAVIYFVPAGYEASGTTLTPSIWAHAWGGTGVMAGTKTLTNWSINGELNRYSRQMPMGVICHEMGHQMCGLPDLYDIGNSNQGLGAFSVMAAGSWGADTGEDDGTTPVSFDAWVRAYCVWDATRLAYNFQSHTFGHALSNTTLKLLAPSASATEYYLAENRYNTNWDMGIRRWQSDYQGGLLIIHVDNTIGTPANNDINKYVAGSHQGVVAVQADNSCNLLAVPQPEDNPCQGNQSVLYYQGHNAAFTPTSTPNSNLYANTGTALGLTGISAVGGTMTATVMAPIAVTAPYLVLLGGN